MSALDFHQGSYRPLPLLTDGEPFEGCGFTLAEAIVSACNGDDAAARNRLIVWAFERGVTVRQLCVLTGLTSTSTIHDIVRRGRPTPGAVLNDECPRELIA